MTFFAGDTLPAATLNNPPWALGTIAYGSRPFSNGNVSLNPSGTTLTGIIRIDNITLKAGRRYLVETSDLRCDMTTSTDRAKFNLHLNTSGTATTSTAVLARSEVGNTTDLNSMPQVRRMVTVGSDTTTASLLLSVGRVLGTGSFLVEAGTDDETLWIAVTDLGLAVTDTGTVLV